MSKDVPQPPAALKLATLHRYSQERTITIETNTVDECRQIHLWLMQSRKAAEENE